MRYTPFETMERLFEQMRRDMSEWRENAWEAPGAFGFSYGLNSDLAERDGAYVLTVDLPGYETEEIDLRYDDGMLQLSATHQLDDESGHRRRTVSERFSLPREIVADEIEASYRNGVLEVQLPIVEGGEPQGHRIDID